MKNKIMILILVLLLTVGFASVSTTIVMNGTIGISPKKSDFKVIFASAIAKGNGEPNSTISENKKSITFNINKLSTVGEKSEFIYKVKNDSTQYDANVSVICTGGDEEYFNILSDFAGKSLPLTTPELMSAQEVRMGKISVELKKASTEEKNISITCNLVIEGEERESIQDYIESDYIVAFDSNGGNPIDNYLNVRNGEEYGELPTPTKENFEFLGWFTEDREKVESTTTVNRSDNHILIAGWKNKNLMGYELSYDEDLDGIEDIGDEIKVGTESFYVISNNNMELNALAKYNLKVGSIYTSDGNLERTISKSEEGYGIQNEQMKGHVSSEEKRYGVVNFSNTNGWPYENNETINIKDYDGPVKEALYGENGYEKYIQKTISNASVRLIIKSEVEKLKLYSWLYNTSYWTQSANLNNNSWIWCVKFSGLFDDYYIFSHLRACGVRPVITIPKNK